ncbi:MAG: M14 family metallocarboxypeptidase [Bacteroidota bacterium]
MQQLGMIVGPRSLSLLAFVRGLTSNNLLKPLGNSVLPVWNGSFLLLGLCFFLFCPPLLFSQPNPQSRKVTEKFFPDVDLNIQTPAFQKKKGFTKYEELMAFLQAYVDAYPDLVQLSFIGKSQKGKEIPLLLLSRPSEEEKVKVWIQAGMHGNEPASTEGILHLLDQLLTEETYQALLDRLEVAIVPMVNIDGYEKQNRYAANGLDLNRDQTKLMAQESISLKQAYSEFEAEVAMDFHEYRPYRKDFAKMSTYGISSIYDAMFLYSGNLNVPENLRHFTKEAFVIPATQAMDQHQLRHHDYMSTTKHRGEIHFNQGSINARSSATSYALTNTISCLFEIRGVGIGRTSFKRRVFTTFLLASSFLQSAYDNLAQIKQEIQQANTSQQEAYVQSKKHVSKQAIQAIDLDKNEEITLEVSIRDAWKSTATLSRDRPTAYLILPDQKAVIEKLSILGLSIERLTEEKSLPVEQYHITEYQKSSSLYEGIHQQFVSTQTSSTTHTFPIGTAIVYLDQQKSNLAIEVLEPEAPNSFVTFEVIETKKEAILPIYRYLQPNRI